MPKFLHQALKALGEVWRAEGKGQRLESGRSESSSTPYWLHSPEASYSSSPSLNSTSHMWVWSVFIPFSFPQRVILSATLWMTWAGQCPPRGTHTHHTHYSSVFTCPVTAQTSVLRQKAVGWQRWHLRHPGEHRNCCIMIPEVRSLP